MKKRLIALLLVLLMLAGVAPAMAEVIEAEPIVAEALPFTDVSSSHPNYASIRFVFENGFMRGISDTEFAPNLSLDRSMVATIIYRLQGEPAITFRQIFSDITSGQWYSLPITWAYDNEVVRGVGDGSFAPLNQITHQELAVMMHRLATSRGYNVSAPAGVTISSQTADWAASAMRWAVHHGFISGNTPLANATRVQTASFVHAFEVHDWANVPNIPEPPAPPAPIDHPIVGRWQLRRLSGRYNNFYDFRADGTVNLESPTRIGTVQWRVVSPGIIELDGDFPYGQPGPRQYYYQVIGNALRLARTNLNRIRYSSYARVDANNVMIVQPGQETHPVVGLWQLLRGDGVPVSEFLRFRPDGIATRESGGNITIAYFWRILDSGEIELLRNSDLPTVEPLIRHYEITGNRLEMGAPGATHPRTYVRPGTVAPPAPPTHALVGRWEQINSSGVRNGTVFTFHANGTATEVRQSGFTIDYYWRSIGGSYIAMGGLEFRFGITGNIMSLQSLGSSGGNLRLFIRG